MELSLEKNPHALSYYSKLTQEYDSGNVQPPDVILPSVPLISKDSNTLPSPQEYLLPSVILWDPMQQLECFKDGIRCPFECHGSDIATLEPRKSKKGEYWWQAGHRLAISPRQLCSSSWPVVLLSRIYFCQGRIKHRSYIAHDPEILSKIPASEVDKIPFVLLHRTGFTKELSDTVFSLVSSGLSLERIEHTITHQHISNFAQCKAKCEEDVRLIATGQEPAQFPEYKPIGVPSMEMLLGSLLINYQVKEAYYTQRMSELSAQILLMGHFFKASQKMGTLKQNKKWLPKYNYLFAVMNEKGQVLAWQATKETSYEDVIPLIQRGLHQRLANQGVTVELILTPDCCTIRESLNSIFGPDVQIKMDPCFAVRKLEKKFKIRKSDQTLMKTCLLNFEFVFRQAVDNETTRSQETPGADVILNNLEAFVSHWKTVRGDSSERLLHEPTLRELLALRSEVTRCCLSGVPAACGEEHISELRDYLRPVLNRRFLNADLTIPAITTLFYVWNELHSGSESPFMNISSYKDALDLVGFVPTEEQFGLAPQGVTETAEKPPNDEESPFHYTFDVHSVQFLIASALGAVEQSTETDREASTLSDSTLRKVLFLAQNYFLVQQSLVSLRPQQSTVNPRLLHLSTCSVLLFSRSDCEVHCPESHETRLRELVSQHSGTLLGDNGDPEGFFLALASSLNQLLSTLESENAKEYEQLKESMAKVGYNPEMLSDEQINVLMLRKIITTEWLENKDRYAPLLMSPLLDLAQEAHNFANEGYYKADLANLLPVTAASIFRLPITIFTSLELFPVVPVVPADQLAASRCVFMGYSAAGYGTYYTVQLEPPPPQVPSSVKPKHVCRCGLGNSKDKNKRQFCVHVPGRYLTRCECYRNGVGCGYLCRCFNCGNPEGTSTDSRMQHTEQKTRSRPRHKFQKARRVETADENTSWSRQESLRFECLVDAMHHPREGLWVLEATPENVLQQYSNLQHITADHAHPNENVTDDNTRVKSLDDVKYMLNVFHKNVEEYGSLYKKQTELNWMQLATIQVTDELTDPDVNQVLVIVESSDQV